MGEQFDIIIKTTAAEAPWSNGLIEHHNGVIGSMMEKVIEETKCSLDVALAWSLSAKKYSAKLLWSKSETSWCSERIPIYHQL